VLSICKNIYTELDDIFIRCCGVTAIQLIELFSYWADNFEIQLNKYGEKLRKVFNERTIEAIVNSYYEEFQLPKNDLSKFVDYLKMQTTKIEDCKCIIYSHSQFFIVEYLQINLQSNSILSKFPGINFEQVLTMLSYTTGDLKEFPIEHIRNLSIVMRQIVLVLS
jgi:hypothetical protein